MRIEFTQSFKQCRHELEATQLYEVLARAWEPWQTERPAGTSPTALTAFVAGDVEAFPVRHF